MKGKRRRRTGLRVRVAVAVALIAAAAVWWVNHELTPVSASRRLVTVTVRPGLGSAGVAALLERKGVIRSASVFRWYAMRNGDAERFKAGVYRLSPSMNAAEIIERLKRGGRDTEDREVTIPEGFTVAQIADALAAKGIVRDRSAFVAVARQSDPPVTAPFALPTSGLEGYLFPDTYRFLPNTPPARAAQAMVDGFTSRFYDPNRAAIAHSGHTLDEIVTIASMIEREAEKPQDRPRIAGVIENRLRRGMRLDIDATVLYALGVHKSRVLYRDLAVDSPYNTYRHKGLPPGPIASPGLPSLDAALHPEHHTYLYYVAGPDGAHIFTRNEKEHNAAVARMRARRSTNGGT